MLKLGRNDPCPCGSGAKLKKCCLEQVEKDRRVALLEAQNEQLRAKVERHEARLEHAKAIIAQSERLLELDELSEKSEALLRAGQLEEAEVIARTLERDFPEDTTGIERLAQVFEARGATSTAVEHYRRAMNAMDEAGEGSYCACCRDRMAEAIGRLAPEGEASSSPPAVRQ